MNNHGTRTWLAGRAGAFLLLLAAASGARALEVRVASQEAIAPKWVLTPGHAGGICPEVMAAVQRIEPRLHFSGYYQSRSLPGIEAGLESGSLDAACGLIRSPRRQAIAVPAGQPVYMVRHLLAARHGDPATVRDIDDLVRMGALVTSQRGSVFTEQLKAAGVRVDDATDDNAMNVRKILAGHGRFAYVNELALHHYVRVQHLENRVRILPAATSAEPAYFWVSRKADPQLAGLLGAALDRLKANGELDRIYARWSGKP